MPFQRGWYRIRDSSQCLCKVDIKPDSSPKRRGPRPRSDAALRSQSPSPPLDSHEDIEEFNTSSATSRSYGGPASMTLGWLVVAAFNGCVALSMVEIFSAYPT
jgi:hypothetical protein